MRLLRLSRGRQIHQTTKWRPRDNINNGFALKALRMQMSIVSKYKLFMRDIMYNNILLLFTRRVYFSPLTPEGSTDNYYIPMGKQRKYGRQRVKLCVHLTSKIHLVLLVLFYDHRTK